MNNDEALAQYFNNVVRQYQSQIGLQTAGYLLQTYQMGQRDVAFTNLIGCLVDLGLNEDELMSGSLGQLAQALNVPTTSSADPDQSAIRIDPSQQPDPFANVTPSLPIRAAADWWPNATQDSVVAGQQQQNQASATPPEPQGSQPIQSPTAPQQQLSQPDQPVLPSPQHDNNGTLHIQQ